MDHAGTRKARPLHRPPKSAPGSKRGPPCPIYVQPGDVVDSVASIRMSRESVDSVDRQVNDSNHKLNESIAELGLVSRISS